MNKLAENFPYIGRLQVKKGWKAVFGMHSHAYSEIMLIIGGKLRVKVGEETFEAEKGDALFYAPEVRHYEDAISSDGADFIFFHVPTDQKLTCKSLIKDPGRRLLALAHWLVEDREKSFEKRDKIVRAYIQAVIAEIEKISEMQPDAPLSPIRNYLMANLSKSHTINYLAKRAGMSRFHFIRKYCQDTGLTPIQDLLQLRVEAACNLLITTKMPLKQIAQETGFCDEFYFSRTFRKHLGTTPGAFRSGRIKH